MKFGIEDLVYCRRAVVSFVKVGTENGVHYVRV